MIANNTTKSAKKQKVWNNKVENTENHLRQLSCHFWRETKKTFPRKSSFETIIASLDEQLKSAFVCNIILSCKTSLKVKSFELKEITNFETEKVTRCEKLKSYFFLLFALKMFRRQCKQTHFFLFWKCFWTNKWGHSVFRQTRDDSKRKEILPFGPGEADERLISEQIYLLLQIWHLIKTTIALDKDKTTQKSFTH